MIELHPLTLDSCVGCDPCGHNGNMWVVLVASLRPSANVLHRQTLQLLHQMHCSPECTNQPRKALRVVEYSCWRNSTLYYQLYLQSSGLVLHWSRGSKLAKKMCYSEFESWFCVAAQKHVQPPWQLLPSH